MTTVSTEQLFRLTVTEMSRLLLAGDVTSVAITESVLARAEETDPTIHAYVTLMRERALAEASQADEEFAAGRRRGPLHGIPISVKDAVDLAGEPTLVGSRSRARDAAEDDAALVQRLRDAGAVICGKTLPHEHMFGVETPPARTPWDPERIPGGSSGGSAASVGAGSSAASIGTDTGGSIRLPAAFCGVVGLKPTYGRVSKRGVVPAAWTLDHVGPIARTVEDVALVLGAIAGADRADPSTSDVPVPDYTAGLDGGIRGMRIGIPRGIFWEWCDPAVENVVREAIATLGMEGAELVEIDLALVEYTLAAGFVIALVENATHHRRSLRERAHLYEPGVRALFDAGAVVFGADYLDAQRVRVLVRREFRRAFEEHRLDLLVTPSAPTVPPRAGEQMISIRGRP